MTSHFGKYDCHAAVVKVENDSSSCYRLPIQARPIHVVGAGGSENAPARLARLSRKTIQRMVSAFFVALVLLALLVGLSSSSIGIAAKATLARHPLSSATKSSKQNPDDGLRYITFGSSLTWGKGLAHPTTQSYPYLLSATVHNVASSIGGLSVSAICTQSIVQDNIYDVIVLEFSEADGNDSKALLQLAQRLRQRFPNAEIVFVQLWTPQHILYRDQATNATTAATSLSWSEPQSPKPDAIVDRDSFRSSLLEHPVYGKHSNWEFDTASITRQQESLKQSMQQVGAHLYTLPHGPDFVENAKGDSALSTLVSSQYLEWFQFEGHLPTKYLSHEGHKVVASGIYDSIIKPKFETRLEKIDRNAVGSWHPGDYCSLWYNTGDYSTNPTLSVSGSARKQSVLHSRRRVSAIQLDSEYGNDTNKEKDTLSAADSTAKFALEISRKGGSIYVTNPFPEPRMLYLTYMTAPENAERGAGSNQHALQRLRQTIGGKSNSKVYPRTKVILGGKPTLVLDPIHDNPRYSHDHRHFTRTTAVGTIPPGKTLLELQPSILSNSPLFSSHSVYRFRLVGYSVLDDAIVDNVPFEFDIEPEPVQNHNDVNAGIGRLLLDWF